MWTQEQAVAFECAQETITDLMAILTAQLHAESEKRTPDPLVIQRIEHEHDRLAVERRDLHVHDESAIQRINKEYGALVRAWRLNPERTVTAA